MRLKKALQACQKKLDFTEGLLNMVQISQTEPEPKLPRSSNPDQTASIAEAIQSDLARNLQVMETQRRYGDETYNPTFVMRTLSCQAYDFLRGLIPLSLVKLLDERFKADLEAIQMQSTQLEHLPTLLDQYKTTHISD
jgi:hypothetical protein